MTERSANSELRAAADALADAQSTFATALSHAASVQAASSVVYALKRIEQLDERVHNLEIELFAAERAPLHRIALRRLRRLLRGRSAA